MENLLGTYSMKVFLATVSLLAIIAGATVMIV